MEKRRSGNKLEGLGEIRLERIENYRDIRYGIWKEMIKREHYIGHGHLYGLQIKYLIRAKKGEWIGAISYSSAAWRLSARDSWIGWNEENRVKHLQKIICNSRFLIRKEIKVENLASHVLALSIRQVKRDWEELFKVEPVLIETFVEKNRFSGTCYQAANFKYIGDTRGRGRNDRGHEAELPIKSIYVYPLKDGIQKELCRGQEEKIVVQKMDWAEEEFKNSRLKDKRLKKRLLTLVRDFYGKPGVNIPQASNSRSKTKAAYRFFDHEAVNMDEILVGHYQSTLERIKKEKIVLAVQDTTSLNYSTHLMTEGLGPIGTKKDGAIGLELHSTLAFTLEGTPLGLLNVQCWGRDAEEFGKKHKRREKVIEEKESYKWIESYQETIAAQAKSKNTQLVSIGDREADIYDLLKMAVENKDNPAILIRASHNRSINAEQQHLWDYLRNTEESGIQRIQIPRKANNPAREADLSIHYKKVELKPPQYKKDAGSITIWAILAYEKKVPAGVVPVEWMLLTTIAINTFEEATEKLGWYSKRWGIEIYHKTLKSGCKIEERQLGKVSRIESCLAIDMVVAWRIYYLTKLGREIPDVSCTVFFEEAEWKALVVYKTKNPIPPALPPSLREAIHMIASLGGFLCRKGDGEPGTKVLWLGLSRLDDIIETYKIFTSALSPP